MTGRDRALTVMGVASIIGLLFAGFAGGARAGSSPLPRSARVVLVSVPGLRWQDLDAVPTEHIAPLLTGSGLLSVRSIGPDTSLLEGYLAFGAGNRLDTEPTEDLFDPHATCLPALVAAARADADDELNGAEPGALGAALHGAGLTTAVFGSTPAVAALMDDAGCVDAHGPAGEARFDADVTLVELPGLHDAASAADRSAAMRRIDAGIGVLPFPDDATVVLFAPTATGDVAEVLVAGVRDVPPSVRPPAALVSPSTRRVDYVQLTDLGPTVLDVLGLHARPSMSGTVIGTVNSTGEIEAQARTHRLADTAERVLLRDRAVGPVSVILVVLMVLCGAAGLARRSRIARLLAPIVVAYPTVTFLLGLTGYHQLPLDFLVVATAALAAAVAALAVALTTRWGRWAPVSALAGALWLTLMVDVITGGALQINTPLGYSPTVAGRFQGLGNLSFGLVAAAALVVALIGLLWPRLGLPATGWAAWVGVVTTVVVAAPAFGSDVGGTLALVPSFAVVLTVLSGRRVGAGRAVLVGVGTCAAVIVLAVLDRARDPASRTHLGRFLDEVLDGGGGLVIRRKLSGNLAILTSSFWSGVLVLIFAAVAVIGWRLRDVIRGVFAARPAVRAFVAGWAVVAVLGFALNDSGLAVPAIMLDVAIAWLVAMMIPPAIRAGRAGR